MEAFRHGWGPVVLKRTQAVREEAVSSATRETYASKVGAWLKFCDLMNKPFEEPPTTQALM